MGIDKEIRNMNKVIFVDLDHTLITTISGKKFPIHSKDWKFMPDTVAVLNNLAPEYRIAIISNQEGITDGFVSEKVFLFKIEEICCKLEKILKLKKNRIIYRYCRHKKSYYQKPNPGMILDILLEEELVLEDSVMIGDSPNDEALAKNAGIQNYMYVSNLRALDIKF
tara:strand:+ start:2980 stop:3480 length:501 start_codon:yes stop_codon:yes gene_type:complete